MEDFDFPQSEFRSKKDLFLFKSLIKKSIKKQNKFGRLWIIDKDSNTHESPFDKILKL
jgi:hypothetical protein